MGAGICATSGLVFALEKSVVKASDQVVHPYQLPWPHSGVLDSFDYNS